MNPINSSQNFLGANSTVCPSRVRGINKQMGGGDPGSWGRLRSHGTSDDLITREGRIEGLRNR